MAAPAMALEPSTPFVITGHVSDSDTSPCNDPAVLVTNTNTSESWDAENDSESNYYKLVLDSDNVSAGDVLQIEASGCSESKIVEHTVTQSEMEDGGMIYFDIVFDAAQEIIWQGNVTLINGTTFDKTAHNSGVSYELDRTTALGALDAATEEGVFNYTMNDEWYELYGSLFVDSIADISNEGYNGWMYWVNYPEDPMPMVGADQFVLEDGDVVTWYWSSSMEMTPANSSMLVNVNVAIEEPQEIIWQGNVTLINETTFNITAHNSGVSYELDRTTALGALDAAAEEGVFNYTMNDEWYELYGSLFVDSIADIPNEGYNGWMYWVNYPEDPMPMVGADQFVLEDGDVVTWYWSSSMEMTPANSSMLVNVNVAIEEPQEIIWQGNVTLINETTFNITAHNSGVSYELDRTTALGALDAAAEEGVFNYTMNDEWYELYGSLFVDSIADIPNEGYNGWMYWVNYPEDPMPMVGADQFVLEDGDIVTWYWSTSMDMTPDDSPMLVNVNVAVESSDLATYDFTTGAGIDKWAYRYQTDAKPAANGTTPDIEFMNNTNPRKDQYVKISTDNRKTQSDSTDMEYYYAAHRFVFNITQPVEDILTIEVLWNGKGAHTDRKKSGATLYIRNGTSGAYEELDNTTSNKEVYLSAELTGGFGNYIDADGYLTVLVEQNSAQTVKGKREYVSKLSTDYVKVDITHT